jgi:hypothetical protein
MRHNHPFHLVTKRMKKMHPLPLSWDETVSFNEWNENQARTARALKGNLIERAGFPVGWKKRNSDGSVTVGFDLLTFLNRVCFAANERCGREAEPVRLV